MVDLLEETQLKWNETLEENKILKAKISCLENVNGVQKAKLNEKFMEELDTSICSNYTTCSPKSLSNENKKRRKVNFRRSSSLPARNEIFMISENDDDIVICENKDNSKRAKYILNNPLDNLKESIHDRNLNIVSSCSYINELCPVETYETKSHSFSQKRNFIRINCSYCENAIRFGVMFSKCSNCKGTFHESCRKKAALPCIARKDTPKSSKTKGRRLRLGDFCPDSRPMIPPLVAHCVNYLNNNPSSDYLYQVVGDMNEVNQILKLYTFSKNYPKLDNFNKLNIAECVKKFLTQIREPLIPFSYAKEFILAANEGNDEDLLKIVRDLPTAHMDTLACLIRHWIRLQDYSFEGSLSIDSLTKHLGPIVFGVGFGASSEITSQAAIHTLRCLFKLPQDIWRDLINVESIHSSRSTTPLMRNQSIRSSKFNIVGSTSSIKQENRTPQYANMNFKVGDLHTTPSKIRINHV